MMRHARNLDDGALLRLLALAHTFVGVALHWPGLRSIARGRILASIPYRGPKATAFWFLVPSPLIWIIGRLITNAERNEDWQAIRAAHRSSFISAVTVILLLPISGFWVWLAISVRGYLRALSR